MPWYDVAGKDSSWVVDQILDAIHTYAYAYFERTRSYRALLDSALKYGTLNHAQQFSTPVLMALLGRREELRDFVALCESHGVTGRYKQFIAKLEPYLAGKSLLPY